MVGEGQMDGWLPASENVPPTGMKNGSAKTISTTNEGQLSARGFSRVGHGTLREMDGVIFKKIKSIPLSRLFPAQSVHLETYNIAVIHTVDITTATQQAQKETDPAKGYFNASDFSERDKMVLPCIPPSLGLSLIHI